MSIEKNKAVVRRLWEEVWNQRCLSVCDEIFDTDYAEHEKSWVPVLLAAFPDVHFTIEDMIAEGDKVVVYWTMSGTQKGEFAGIPPTGKRIAGIQGVIIHRLSNGKIVEDKAVRDTMSMMQQLGAIPAPGQSGS